MEQPPEINPYESPQARVSQQNQPPARKTARRQANLDLQGGLAMQIIALVTSVATWIASEMSAWGKDIQHYARIAVVAGGIAGFLGIVIIVNAKKQSKPRWVFFETLLIIFLIACALVRLS